MALAIPTVLLSYVAFFIIVLFLIAFSTMSGFFISQPASTLNLLYLILRILKLGILPEITPLWAFGNDFSSFQAVC